MSNPDPKNNKKEDLERTPKKRKIPQLNLATIRNQENRTILY
jgi:hypothetical protein